jgi:hypothetical protein
MLKKKRERNKGLLVKGRLVKGNTSSKRDKTKV